MKSKPTEGRGSNARDDMSEPKKRGAKKLPPNLKKVGGSIALTPAQWRKLDRLRGKTSRGAFIAEKLLGKQSVNTEQPDLKP